MLRLGMVTKYIYMQFSGWQVFLKGKWVTADFVTNYLPLMLFPVLYIGATLWKRVPPVKIQDMDFISGLDEIEADTYDEPPPRNKWEAFWQWMVRRLSRLRIPALVLTCYADVIVFFSLSLLEAIYVTGEGYTMMLLFVVVVIPCCEHTYAMLD